MELYVEYVLIDNFFIDYFVLYVSALIIKRRVKWWRMTLSALLGALYAVAAPLIPYPYDIAPKILSLLIMCAVAVGVKKPYFKFTIAFLAITCFLGGLVTAGKYFASSITDALSEPNSCLAAVVSGAALLLVIAVRMTLRALNHGRKHGELLAVELDTGKAEYIDKALYDSGNRLYYKGLYPVIVIDNAFESGRAVGRIKIKTVNGTAETELYNVRKLIVNGTVYRDVYAVKRELDSGYKIILHADFAPKALSKRI